MKFQYHRLFFFTVLLSLSPRLSLNFCYHFHVVLPSFNHHFDLFSNFYITTFSLSSLRIVVATSSSPVSITSSIVRRCSRLASPESCSRPCPSLWDYIENSCHKCLNAKTKKIFSRPPRVFSSRDLRIFFFLPAGLQTTSHTKCFPPAADDLPKKWRDWDGGHNQVLPSQWPRIAGKVHKWCVKTE